MICFLIVIVEFWNRAAEWSSIPALCDLTAAKVNLSGVGLGLGQVLQRLALAAHTVVAHVSRDVEASLAEVKVQRWFVPVQDGEVELVAAGS